MIDIESKLIAGLEAVSELIAGSGGVFGLHSNGYMSQWEELRSGGKYEEWLSAFDEATNIVRIKRHEQARIQHEIKMTDDPIYRDWYRQEQRRKEIEENGINED